MKTTIEFWTEAAKAYTPTTAHKSNLERFQTMLPSIESKQNTNVLGPWLKKLKLADLGSPEKKDEVVARLQTVLASTNIEELRQEKVSAESRRLLLEIMAHIAEAKYAAETIEYYNPVFSKLLSMFPEGEDWGDVGRFLIRMRTLQMDFVAYQAVSLQTMVAQDTTRYKLGALQSHLDFLHEFLNAVPKVLDGLEIHKTFLQSLTEDMAFCIRKSGEEHLVGVQVSYGLLIMKPYIEDGVCAIKWGDAMKGTADGTPWDAKLTPKSDEDMTWAAIQKEVSVTVNSLNKVAFKAKLTETLKLLTEAMSINKKYKLFSDAWGLTNFGSGINAVGHRSEYAHWEQQAVTAYFEAVKAKTASSLVAKIEKHKLEETQVKKHVQQEKSAAAKLWKEIQPHSEDYLWNQLPASLLKYAEKAFNRIKIE